MILVSKQNGENTASCESMPNVTYTSPDPSKAIRMVTEIVDNIKSATGDTDDNKILRN
jgi:hypothetical protein